MQWGNTRHGKVRLQTASETIPFGSGAATVQLPNCDGADQPAVAAEHRGYAGIPRWLCAAADAAAAARRGGVHHGVFGGGKRSAAFAHGVLRGLRQIPVIEDGRTRSLLDELDYIASVSGGSFPAAHYGLYREKSFETFPREFLKGDINAFVY